jgi:hypothetical protein
LGRAILLNLQGSVWVATVLAVTAIYEASEVIAIMGRGIVFDVAHASVNGHRTGWVNF